MKQENLKGWKYRRKKAANVIWTKSTIRFKDQNLMNICTKLDLKIDNYSKLVFLMHFFLLVW